MASFEATYWLAAGHIVVVVVALALTPRPLVSTYHWLLLASFLAFGIRPMLAASVGGYTNYDSGAAWSSYNYGLLYQLLFLLCLSAAYVLMYHIDRPHTRPLEFVPGARAFYVLFAVGLLALGALHVLSGGAWLPGARTGTINTAVPGGKYIFPFAVMSFSLLIPFGIIGCIRKVGIKPWVAALATVVSLTALSLLFMRGMVISGVLLVLWAIEKQGKLKARHLLIGLLAVFMIGQLLRPIGRYVAMQYMIGDGDGGFAAAATEQLSPSDRARALFLFTTNLDWADSWPVVIDYAEQNRFLNGRSFLAVPARFASTKFRLDSGYLTGSDIINDFFYGSNYGELSFGLNVTLANELFLNFGGAGLLLGLLPGLATWAADKWMRRTRYVSPFGLFVAFICFRGFVGELATTIQWAVGALVLALVVKSLTRLSLGKPRGLEKSVREPELTST